MGFQVSCTYGARAHTQQTQVKSDAQYWPTRLDTKRFNSFSSKWQVYCWHMKIGFAFSKLAAAVRRPTNNEHVPMRHGMHFKIAGFSPFAFCYVCLPPKKNGSRIVVVCLLNMSSPISSREVVPWCTRNELSYTKFLAHEKTYRCADAAAAALPRQRHDDTKSRRASCWLLSFPRCVFFFLRNYRH